MYYDVFNSVLLKRQASTEINLFAISLWGKMKFINRVVIGIVIVSFFSSCTARLSKEGMAVKKITIEDRSRCLFISSDYVSTVTGGFESFHAIQKNINKMKNKVAGIGGNAYIVLDRSSRLTNTIYFDIYTCNIVNKKG